MSALKVRAAGEQAFGSSPSRPGQTQGGRASGQGASSIDSIDSPEWKRREVRGQFF